LEISNESIAEDIIVSWKQVLFFILFLTTAAHGYYGIGSHSDGAMYYNNRTFATSEWKLMDQPFTTDGTVFKIAPGHCQSIVYIGAGTLLLWKFLQ
jgi:hypothetical protein